MKRKTFLQAGLILALIFPLVLALAQDTGLTPPSSPLEIKVCGDGIFTITVTNRGLTQINNIEIRADVPGNFDLRSSGTTPGYTLTLSTISWPVFNLAGGATESRSINISPQCNAPSTRQLDVRIYVGGSLYRSLSSNTITVLPANPNLVIDVTPQVDTGISPGSEAEWVVRVRNTGVDTLYGAWLDAELPAGAGLSDLERNNVDFDGNPITLPDISPGGSALVGTFTALVTPGATTSCENLKVNFWANYGCGGVGCLAAPVTAEGSVELLYKTPNLDYEFYYTDPGVGSPSPLSSVSVPFCGTRQIWVRVTNSGAGAGGINTLHMGMRLSTPLRISSASTAYTVDPGNPNIVEFDNLGSVAAGGSIVFNFTIRWADPCNPTSCQDIIFTPHFFDDCGDLFQPPVKELPVASPPFRPYFTVSKTRSDPTNVLDENEAETFNIAVTFTTPPDFSGTTTATVRDTFPSSFTFSSASPGGTLNAGAHTYTWNSQVFNPNETKNYQIRLVAGYAGTTCGAGISNVVDILNPTAICPGGGCSVTTANATLSIFNANMIFVEKSGPNSLYVNDATYGTYTVRVRYRGPRCYYGGVLSVPPMTIVDTLPGGADTLNESRPWTVSGQDRTWDIPSGNPATVGWVWDAGTLEYVLTITYDMRILSTAPGYNVCECGTPVNNHVAATLSGASCMSCSNSADLAIAVECDNELNNAPFSATKGAAPASREICDATGILYTNSITFNRDIAGLANITFTENGNNNQVFASTGTATGSAHFVLTRGASTWTDDEDITLGTGLTLDNLDGFPAGFLSGDVLTVTYTLYFASSSTPQTFVDWTDIRVVGNLGPCGADNGEYHEGVWVTAFRSPPSISISEFCHYILDDCSYTVNKCAEEVFRVKVHANNPSYGTNIVVDLLGNYDYVPGSTTYTGVLSGPINPTPGPPYGSVLTWNTGTIPTSGDGYLQFRAYKDCDEGNAATATVSYNDRCAIAGTPVQASYPPFSITTRSGDLVIKKTPDVIYVKDRVNYPTWVLYVTNAGSGTASGVTVNDYLQENLIYRTGSGYVDRTGWGVSGSAEPALPAPYDAVNHYSTYRWSVGDIPPGKTVKITLTASVAGCTYLKNFADATWGCGTLTCGTTAKVESVVKELPGKAIITTHGVEPINLCTNYKSKATIEFQNIGDTQLYNLKLTEKLPANLEYAGNPFVVCGGCSIGGPAVPDTSVPGELTWRFTDAAGMAPGDKYTITFDVWPNQTNPCLFNPTTGVLNATLTYETPCGGGADKSALLTEPTIGGPVLTVTKSPDTIVGEPGETLTWTITITNHGTMPAQDIEFWDTFPTNIDGTTSVLKDSLNNVIPKPAGANPPGSGNPWVLAGIPALGTVTYYLSAEVADTLCSEGETNTANVEYGCCTRTLVTDTSTVVNAPIVTIDHAVGTTPPMNSCGGTLILYIRNEGSHAYVPAGGGLVETLPAGFAYVSGATVTSNMASTRGWSTPQLFEPTSNSGGVLTWGPAKFAAGSPSKNIVFEGETITITVPIVPTVTSGSCTANPGGPNGLAFTYSENASCLTGSISAPAPGPLTITTTSPSVTLQPKNPLTQVLPAGGTMIATWQITINNTGGGRIDGTLLVIDYLGNDYDMSYYGGTYTPPDLNGTPGVADPATHTITWTGVSMPAGGQIQFNLNARTVATPVEAALWERIEVSGACLSGCVYAATLQAVGYVGYSDISKRYVDKATSATKTTATIGETVGVEITASYYGSGTSYSNIRVIDTLPNYLRFVPGSAKVGIDSATPSVSGQVLTFNLPNASGNKTFVITFDAVVENNINNQAGGSRPNNVLTRYNIGTEEFTDTATPSPLRLVTPLLTIDKYDNESGDDGIVHAGDTYTYFITLTSPAGANRSTAYDIVLTDLVDFNLGVGGKLDVTSVSDGGHWDPVAHTVTWPDPTASPAAPPINMAPGTSHTYSYTVVVKGTAEPGEVLENTARVTWTSTSGDNVDERYGGGTALNNYNASDSNSVTVETTSRIEKGPDGAPRDVTIGTTVPYTIDVYLPRATIPSVTIRDTIATGIYYRTGYATVTFPDTTSAVINPAIESGDNDGTGPTTLRWSGGNFNSVNATSGRPLSITFWVVAANESVVQDTMGPITNSASYVYTDNLGGTHSGSDSSGNLRVVEANLTVTKTSALITGTRIEAGSVIEYTLTVTNTGGSTAYDSIVTDTIPTGLTLVPGSTTPAGSESAPVVSWSDLDIAPGAANAVTLRYRVTVGNGVQPNEAMTNSVVTTWTSLSGSPPFGIEERTGAGGVNDYRTTTSIPVTVVTGIDVTKTLLTTSTVTIGSVSTYRIQVDLPRATIPVLTVVDSMDAGLIYRGVNVIRYPDGTTGTPAPTINPAANDGLNATDLTWTFNGPAGLGLDASSGNPLIIEFTAEVADLSLNKDNTSKNNSALGRYTDWKGLLQSDTSSVSKTLRVPALTIDKSVSSIIRADGANRTASGVVEPGDTVTYTIVVRNVGTGVANAVEITDSVLAGFTYVAGSATTPPGVTVSGPNPLVWRIASIPGAGSGANSVTVSFSVTATSAIAEGAIYTNCASVVGHDILGNDISANNNVHLPTGVVDTYETVGGVEVDRSCAPLTGAIPTLSLVKAILSVNGTPYASGMTVQPGDYIVFRVTVSNTGTGTAYDVDLNDTLSEGLGYGDYLAPLTDLPPHLGSGTYTSATWSDYYTAGGSPTGSLTAHSHNHAPEDLGGSTPATIGTITWDGSDIRPLLLPGSSPNPSVTGIVLPGGQSYTIEYVAYVNGAIIQHTVAENLAGAEGKNGAGATVTSNIMRTVIGTREPFFVTDKTITQIDGNPANTTVAVVDSIIDYSFTVTNVGEGDAYHITVSDTLPVGFVYVDGTTSIDGIPIDDSSLTDLGTKLTWNLNRALGSTESFTIAFKARVTDGTSGGTLTNVMWVEGLDLSDQPVTKNGSSITPLDTDNDDTDEVPVQVDIPNKPLILEKDVTPRSVGSGAVVHYTVTFTNNRKISFYDATITDTLPPGFKYLPGTTLINGVPAADPVGNNPYVYTIGTVGPESVTTLDYSVLVTHSARHGANVNWAVLNAHDGAGKPISLKDRATVTVTNDSFFDFEKFPFLTRITRPTAPAVPVRLPEKERPRPECCLHVAMIPVRSQDFGDTLPGRPEIYYQTDIAMYGATELYLTEKRLNPWLEVQGFDPERQYLMTGLYNRMITKLGEYAQYNLGNVVMESLLGIPLDYAPGILEKAKREGVAPERASNELMTSLAKRAGLSAAPDIQPIFLEYFGSYPYLHGRIAEDKLAWEDGLMDKNVMPAALGFTLLREANQIDVFLASADPTERFFGLLLLTQAVEKTASISNDLAKTARFSPPVKYLPHFSRIEVDKGRPGLVWRTTDETSTLYDHASVLWGLSKLRSVILHSADPEVRALLPQITERMDEVYRAIEAIHYDKQGKTFVSVHSPAKAEGENSVTAKDLAFTILALRSVLLENRDLSLNTIDPKRKITEIADFMIDKLMGDGGGIYTAYNYADGTPVVGVKRTLVDNALAVRALLSAYVVTDDRKYRDAALKVYAFMVKELWLDDLKIFIDEENPDYEVVLTPQSIGALIGALRELVLYGDPAMRHDYLDRMSYTTDRILDQSQLQLYENRFFPWHAPITIVPKDPNGRSYIKPIIATMRDKGISRDLAPILVRKMVLNITPAGAISSGNEAAVSDWNKWKADLRYEVPDVIASSVIDDTFVTDEGMYFTTLTRDYQANLHKDLPAFNPYNTDPGIQVYGAFVGGEVSRYNVENLTLNSGMGIGLSESELVRRLAEKAGKNPKKYLTDYVKKHAPKDGLGESILRRFYDTVKGAVGLDRDGRFADIIYLEYASGKPYYTENIGNGWNEKTFDKKLTVSSVSSTMVRQLLFILDNSRRTDLSASDRFVNDVITLSVAAKRVALGEIIANAEKNGIDGAPHSFTMVVDEKEKRTVPEIVEKKSTLFDDTFAIWAMALFIDARQRGLFGAYRPFMSDETNDEKILSGLIDALIAHHYNAEYGTLVTGSVNTVDVSKVLDMLTRAVEVMADGPAKEKLTGLIKKQADFIMNRLVTDTGFAPMVGLGNEKIPTDLCEMETLGTNVFPILALLRTSEVTGDGKYLKAALTYFDRFDKSKWDQTIGLYLSSGTIYKAPDRSKLELKYNNQELIAAVLLVSKLQPHLSGERKILSAYHMTTFMNRIMEIASVERYPGSKESNKTIFSPEIIRSVKIILTESKGVGKPGDIFTNRIVIDNDCYDLVDRTLSRIRIEETMPDGFHYVPGSTLFNGAVGPDPIGIKTLNWYYPSLAGKGRLVIDYQVVADPRISEGSYTTNLDVVSFTGQDGSYAPCVQRNVAATTVIIADPFKPEDVTETCVPCEIGRRALSR